MNKANVETDVYGPINDIVDRAVAVQNKIFGKDTIEYRAVLASIKTWEETLDSEYIKKLAAD